ncbi:MAG: peptidoglycan DD-metalloendopeptidase family protein [bacterium]
MKGESALCDLVLLAVAATIVLSGCAPLFVVRKNGTLESAIPLAKEESGPKGRGEGEGGMSSSWWGKGAEESGRKEKAATEGGEASATIASKDSAPSKEERSQDVVLPWAKVESPPEERKGVYHTVKRGQTLWRIAKTYGVDMYEIMRENDKKDSLIKEGERLFIPGATRVLPVMSYFSEDEMAGGPRTQFILPVVSGTLTSPFGVREGVPHNGWDIAAEEGADILAAADGKVVYSDDDMKGYGNMIILQHEDGYFTLYAHNRVNLVREGELVRQGQIIAKVGKTGEATGPHLHFEVRLGDKALDPKDYLSEDAVSRIVRR